MGGLERQIVGVNFTQGLETREDERLVIPGKLLAAENVTLSDSGALSRRDGWETLETAAAANGLATFQRELLVVNGSALSTLAGSTDVLYGRGTLSPLTLAKESVRRDANFQAEVDCASSGDFTCYIWRDYSADQTTINGIYATIIDEETGAVMMARTQLSGSTGANAPRVVYAAATGPIEVNAFILVWEDGAASSAVGISVASNTNGVFTPAPVANVIGTYSAGSHGFDLARGSDGKVLLLYSSADVTNSVFIDELIFATDAGVTVASTFAVASQATIPLDKIRSLALSPFSASHRYGAFVYAESGGAYAGIWGATYNSTSTGALSAALTNLDSTAPSHTAGNRITATAVGVNMHVYADEAGYYGTVALPGGVKPIRKVVVSVAQAISSGPTTIIYSNCTAVAAAPAEAWVNGPFIAAKAFTVSGASYLPVFIGGTGRTRQSEWLLLDSSGTPVARALDASFGYRNPTFGVLANSCPCSTPTVNGVVVVPAGEQGILIPGETGLTTSVGISRLLLSFYGSTPPVRAELAGNTFFAGGLMSSYDGKAVTETGFLMYPEGVSIVDGAAGAIPAGTYQYVALYEWTDGQGQRHQSAPSVAVSYVAPGSKKATVTIPTLILTQKNGVNLAVYRTKVSDGVFFRLNSITSPQPNVTTSASVVYTDNALDTALTGETLYTTGDVLPNDAPPACSVLAVHQGRLFIAGLENPSELRYSQPTVDGFGLQWNETLAGLVDASGGPITALASMDEKLVILCERRPYVVAGTGPNTTGGQNNYTAPEEVTADAGCTEPRSVLKMPNGLLFKATKGWHILNRGLQLQYVGAGVEAYNANSVSAAVLLDDRKECRFYSSAGTTLVYSYLVDQWETSSDFAAVDAVWWPTESAVVWATAAGAINKDTPGEYEDSGVAITATFDTGWLKPGATLHGFQRVYELLLEGPYFSSGTLTISAFYDYSMSQGDTVAIFGGMPYCSNFESLAAVTFNPTSALKSPDGSSWGLRWKLPRQKCSAVRFRITETPSGGTLAGLGFSSMSLDLGIKRGAYKLPAAQSA